MPSTTHHRPKLSGDTAKIMWDGLSRQSGAHGDIIWRSEDGTWLVTRMDLAGRLKPPRWMYRVQTAARLEIGVGDVLLPDDVVYGLWLAGPAGPPGRCRIIGLVNEARWPERLGQLDQGGNATCFHSYPYGPRMDPDGERLPSIPAISRVWVAEVYRRNRWGTRLAQAVVRHHHVDKLAWRLPLTEGGLGLAKAMSADGSVWGW